MDDNTITGLGPVPFIAQNGIQFSRGGTAFRLKGNTVTGNIYTQGPAKGYVSTGILLYQANVYYLQDDGTVVNTIEKETPISRNQANVTYIK